MKYSLLKEKALVLIPRICFAFFISMMFNACILDSNGSENDDQFRTTKVFSIDSLTVLANTNRTVSLRSHSTVPTPCYSFSHVDIDRENRDIYINIFARARKETVCIQILGQLESETEIQVDDPGSYNFHFLGEHSNLDTTIVVN